jgi:hypothetical protein
MEHPANLQPLQNLQPFATSATILRELVAEVAGGGKFCRGCKF